MQAPHTDNRHLYQWQAFHKSCNEKPFSVGFDDEHSDSNSLKKKPERAYISAILLLLIPRRIILDISRLFWVQGEHVHLYTGGAGAYSLDVGPTQSTLRNRLLFPRELWK